MAARKVKNNNNIQVHNTVPNRSVSDHDGEDDEDGSPMDLSPTAPRHNLGGLDRLAKRANVAANTSGPKESSYRFDRQNNNMQTVEKRELELVDSALHVENQKEVSAEGTIGELLALNDKLLSNLKEGENEEIDVEYTLCGQTKIHPTVIYIALDDMSHWCMESAYSSIMHKGFVEKEEQFMVVLDYIETQHDTTLKMRSIIIDWLVDAKCNFELRCESVFRTVNIRNVTLPSFL